MNQFLAICGQSHTLTPTVPLDHTSTMAARTATIERKTNETQISVAINLDCQPGTGNKQEISVSTGIGFLDHVCFARLYVSCD